MLVILKFRKRMLRVRCESWISLSPGCPCCSVTCWDFHCKRKHQKLKKKKYPCPLKAPGAVFSYSKGLQYKCGTRIHAGMSLWSLTTIYRYKFQGSSEEKEYLKKKKRHDQLEKALWIEILLYFPNCRTVKEQRSIIVCTWWDQGKK